MLKQIGICIAICAIIGPANARIQIDRSFDGMHEARATVVKRQYSISSQSTTDGSMNTHLESEEKNLVSESVMDGDGNNMEVSKGIFRRTNDGHTAEVVENVVDNNGFVDRDLKIMLDSANMGSLEDDMLGSISNDENSGDSTTAFIEINRKAMKRGKLGNQVLHAEESIDTAIARFMGTNGGSILLRANDVAEPVAENDAAVDEEESEAEVVEEEPKAKMTYKEKKAYVEASLKELRAEQAKAEGAKLDAGDYGADVLGGKAKAEAASGDIKAEETSASEQTATRVAERKPLNFREIEMAQKEIGTVFSGVLSSLLTNMLTQNPQLVRLQASAKAKQKSEL